MSLLGCDNDEGLERVYSLMERNPEGRAILQEPLRGCVQLAGQRDISNLVGE